MDRRLEDFEFQLVGKYLFVNVSSADDDSNGHQQHIQQQRHRPQHREMMTVGPTLFVANGHHRYDVSKSDSIVSLILNFTTQAQRALYQP